MNIMQHRLNKFLLNMLNKLLIVRAKVILVISIISFLKASNRIKVKIRCWHNRRCKIIQVKILYTFILIIGIHLVKRRILIYFRMLWSIIIILDLVVQVQTFKTQDHWALNKRKQNKSWPRQGKHLQIKMENQNPQILISNLLVTSWDKMFLRQL